MSHILSPSTISSFAIGVVCAGIIGLIISPTSSPHQATHGQPYVHVHADFAMILDHELVDFTDDRYQSHADAVKHPSLHLHNNDGHIIHRHAEGVTLGDFFSSLGFSISDTLIITDAGGEYRATDHERVLFFVNGHQKTGIADYVIADEDQLLIYFGDPSDDRITTYLANLTDEACIYSGTCPDRGIAPSSDCGITCDVFDAQ